MTLALIVDDKIHSNHKVEYLEYRLDRFSLNGPIAKNAIFTGANKEQLAQAPSFASLDWKSDLFPHIHPKSQVIASYHNFEQTPEDLEALYQEMQQVPADFYKIATKANSTIDALRMIRFRRNHPNVIGLCMGEKGQLTRIAAPLCNMHHNYVTTGANDLGILTLDELLATYHYRSLSPKTKLYALIGDPITLSPSHITHNQTFHKKEHDGLYVKLQISREELPAFIPYLDLFAGLSVTHPLKEAIAPYLKNLDPEAAEIGAVNTVYNSCGYNTDGHGAWDAIGKAPGKRVAILGRGGAARAAAFEAKKRGFQPTLYHRKTELAPYDILINATPLGMQGELALPIDQILPGTTVLDMVIKETPLVQAALKKKCRVIRGIEMFHKQARAQMAIWL